LGAGLGRHFVDLAAADEGGWLGRRPPLNRGSDDTSAGRLRELGQLQQLLLDVEARLGSQSQADEKRAAAVRSGRVRGGTQWIDA
jgi:hypothetical protein